MVEQTPDTGNKVAILRPVEVLDWVKKALTMCRGSATSRYFK
jgi:hypothetical protein